MRVPAFLTALAVLLCAAALVAPASAGSIVINQWYEAGFGGTWPSPTISPGPDYIIAGNGPLPGGGTQASIAAPATATGTWTIVMSTGGYLVVTDIEASGDQFAISVNGAAATLALNNLNPAGQTGLANGWTSNPVIGAPYASDIGSALSNSGFSSGTSFCRPEATRS
jgi:hypothetical protein